MKLSCVLVACNENTHYLDFWPIVRKAWWEVCELPCVMVYVGYELPTHLTGDPGVLHFRPVDGWPTATQAQLIRLLYPSLLKCDGAVMVSDMDMIPMQSAFFKEGFAKFKEDQFVSLRGIDEEERQIYICYVGATPQTWKDLFGIGCEEDVRRALVELSNTIAADGQHGGHGWYTDQLILYDRIKEWLERCPERVGLIPWTREICRLDKSHPQDWYEFDATKLEKGYIDFHMPSYFYFQKQIDRVFKILQTGGSEGSGAKE